MEVEALPSGHGSLADAGPDRPARVSSLLAAQVDAIEEERRRLARSLNDGPSQALSNIVLRAESLERLLTSDPARAGEDAQRLREAAVFALAEVRRFMFEAYPSVLEDLGLVQTLRRYLQSRSGAGRLALELRVEGDERRLASPAELALFRAAQEGIANAERHAVVREATVTVDFHPDAIEITVSGAGVHFDADEAGQSSISRLSGLPGVRAQLVAANGELRIESAPGGTGSITARIPS